MCHEHEHEGPQKPVIKLMSLTVRVMEAAAVMAAIGDNNDEHYVKRGALWEYMKLLFQRDKK